MSFSLRISRRQYNVLCLVFIVFGVWLLLDELFKREGGQHPLPPNTCRLEYERHPESSTAPQCYLPPGSQFSKVLWVITDGWPRVFADELFSTYKEHGIGYHVDVPGIKLSHSIYISWLTGEPSMLHWLTKEIASYSLLDSMFAAGMKIDFLGKRLSMMRVIGPTREAKLSQRNFVNEADATRAHMGLVGGMDTVLSDLGKSGHSMIAFSALYDTSMHKWGFKDARVRKVAENLNHDLGMLKGWVDNNTDYLLVMSSDHGVDGFGNLLHGHTMAGNDGFLLFYHPSLSPQPEKRIDVVDVGATISGYLKGVDIPTTSVGMAHTQYGDQFHSEARPFLLRQNLAQLSKLAKSQDIKIPPSVESVIEQAQQESGSSLDSVQLEESVIALKGLLKKISTLSVSTILLNVLGFLASFWTLITTNNRSLVQYIKTKQVFLAGSHLLYLVLIYTPVYFSVYSIGLWHIRNTLDYNLAAFSSLTAPLLMYMVSWLSRDSGISQGLITLFFQNSIVMAYAYYIPSELGRDIIQKIPSFLMYALTYWSVAQVYPLEGKKSSRRPILYRVVALGIVVCHMTADLKWAYFMFGFHFVALFVYVALFASIGISLWSKSRNPFHVVVPLGLLAFFLLGRSKADQLLLWLIIYQLTYVFRPLLQKLREHQPPGQNHELLEQLCFVLLFTQTLFVFTVGMENNFDMNVDPFTGRVGIENFDMYPLVSVFFMWYAKYSVWMIFAYFSWSIYSTGHKTYLLPIGVLLMNYTVLNIVFHEMIWRYMMPDRFTEILISTVSLGLIASIYILIDLIKTRTSQPQTLPQKAEV